MLRCGSRVDAGALRPTVDYPEVPLLIEYAGNDASGRGHNRSNDIHVLWRYESEAGEWVELARLLSRGPEWISDMVPIVQRELRGAAPIQYLEVAQKISALVLGVLDRELSALEDEGRCRVMSFLYDQFSARLVA
jgi:hypothetical protein